VELGTSREVSFAADLSCVVNDAEGGEKKMSCDDVTAAADTEYRHRTRSWNTSQRTGPVARKHTTDRCVTDHDLISSTTNSK